MLYMPALSAGKALVDELGISRDPEVHVCRGICAAGGSIALSS